MARGDGGHISLAMALGSGYFTHGWEQRARQ